eukprot:108873-Rhodomonas_salina.1
MKPTRDLLDELDNFVMIRSTNSVCTLGPCAQACKFVGGCLRLPDAPERSASILIMSRMMTLVAVTTSSPWLFSTSMAQMLTRTPQLRGILVYGSEIVGCSTPFERLC